jgi:hypothetical protein
MNVSSRRRKLRSRKIETGVPKEVRIGARLKHARMVRGFTLKKVADAANVPKASSQSWKTTRPARRSRCFTD